MAEPVHSTLLETTPVVIQSPDFGVATVAAEQTDHPYGPAALDVTVGCRTVHLPSFARWGTRCRQGRTFTAFLDFEFVNKADPSLFLFGKHRVVSFSRDGSVTEVTQLNRSQKDDPGFYREFRTMECGTGFFLLYEAGVAKITDTGECEWHTELSWNDWFERLEDDRLVFTNEFINDDDDWYIDTADGKVHQ